MKVNEERADKAKFLKTGAQNKNKNGTTVVAIADINRCSRLGGDVVFADTGMAKLNVTH